LYAIPQGIGPLMWSLRHRVEIERRVKTLNDTGEQIDTWVNVTSDEPAAVEPLRGTEAFAALQINADQPYKIVVRYNPDQHYNANMRVVWEGRTLDVESVAEEMAAGHYVQIYCRERSADGFRQ